MLMSEIEIITDGGRRRRWSATDKLRIVEETMFEGESISAVARRNGVAPNLLYRWRCFGSLSFQPARPCERERKAASGLS